ncbi:MAG TPA: transcriptional regulator [Verrucomicrobiae bacterium]|nr:transcriptional regulator [Verrucomicrobiae bacterium]
MAKTESMVISMRLPAKSGARLKRMAHRHGWTPSDASARLVEEGLRRSEFAFIDFRDSTVGRQACIQGSSLAVWEVMMLARAHGNKVASVATHLGWPEARVQAAFNYARAFPEEIEAALAENDAVDSEALSRMLPQTEEFKISSHSRKH